ncbi:MAG: hypothetical protein ACRD3W_05960, partial [Terriglobales bacterium]
MTQTLLLQAKQNQPGRRRYPACAAPIAVCFYILLLGAVIFVNSRRDKLFVPDLPPHPDVMITGSSVIATPLAMIDSQKRGFSRTDSNRIRRIAFAEKALSERGIASAAVWSAARAGQNIEETTDFVTMRLTADRQPKVLAVFIAPIHFTRQREQVEQESFEKPLSEFVRHFGLDCEELHLWRLNLQLQLT